MVYIGKRMVIYIVEIGKMENKMDQVYIILTIRKDNLESGKMAKS